ncbi:PRMT5 arginine-N-methyltransferase-domain-containing protein [Lipomyces arxii]|uniref:PRMT5 arginine-N-methyltransferase-domain-containing protein n=1 Tax=Lipomyces arxii TaxID=56418 RepID=UPI0034CF288D
MTDKQEKSSDQIHYVGQQPELQIFDAKVDADTCISSTQDGYDVLVVPITNQQYKVGVTKTIAENGRASMISPPTFTEVNIAPNINYSRHVFGMTADWINLESSDSHAVDNYVQVLKHELSYASFCGLAFVVVPGPKRRNHVATYAQALKSAMSVVPIMNIVIQLQMTEIETDQSSDSSTSKTSGNVMSIWEIWNSIRTLCEYSNRLSVGLQVPAKLPHQSVVLRWFAEPISILFLSASIFLENAKQYPVLSRAHQLFLFKYLKIKPSIVLQDILEATKLRTRSKIPSKQDQQAYLIYIRHLHTAMPSLSAMEKFGQGYYDYLQNPLQPLSDNLESGTYEVFEKDPVKYEQYEKAIFQALSDRAQVAAGQPITVAVVGAGRGPLVARALKAAERAKVTIITYAVEKNPNAYAYLLQRKQLEWHNSVEVVHTDMRLWNPRHKIDVMVSELLGSFGDNELSPECLDGVQHALKADGIMIPKSYSAHLIPGMSPKIHMLLKAHNKEETMNTPYVVLLQACDLLAKEIHKAWEFEHPSPYVDTKSQNGLQISMPTSNAVGIRNEHNNRAVKTRFAVENRSVMHGFVGYFESVLYGEVELSIRPDTINAKSRDMVSWFPIWFPISDPLYVPDESEIEISLWRKTDNKKVWYEWSVESFIAVPGRTPDNRDSMASNASTTTTGSSRRIRLGCTKLHNFGGKYSFMIL